MSAGRGEAGAAVRVAVVVSRGKFMVAEPLFEAGPQLVVSPDSRARAGDLVTVKPGTGREGRRSRRAVIAGRLGRPDVARDVIEALMIDRGLRRGFDPAVEHEARHAAGAQPLGDSSRRDLRSLATFTIDPASARDFDDAISAQSNDDGSLQVSVHIADVSAYVPPRSTVDREAYRRATSVYVPGAVEPMLPRELSNHACSLVPGEDRLTLTVELTIDGDQLRRAAFYRSVIRSDQRLEYGQVDRIFAGQQQASEPWGPALAVARAAADALWRRRSTRAVIDVESAEPEFSFDPRGNLVSAQAVAQTESHRLIEQLMIAANEQVARHLSERRVPTLYRVHERPEGAAVERLVEQLHSLGVPTPPVPRGHLTPQQAAELSGEASRLVSDWVRTRGHGARALTTLVLRSLKQACYDNRNLGHAGLASSYYCHFTSPIRRYPDLICHRALLSTIAGGPRPDSSWVAAAGPWTSAREREAMTIERDADDIAGCFLLQQALGEAGRDTIFAGEVVGLIGAGAFVAFGEQGLFEGMLPVRKLGGDWWELNEEATVLVGTRNGATIRLGDPIGIAVERVDAPRGRVDLLPAEAPGVLTSPASPVAPARGARSAPAQAMPRASGRAARSASGRVVPPASVRAVRED